MNKAASASRTAASVWTRIRPGRDCGSSSSNPAVSMTLKTMPARFASPSRRSRVTPGRSSTSARRFPTSLLNRVDLPTFGRPTMATVGSGMRCAIAAPHRRRDSLAVGVKPPGVVVDVERRVRDDRRDADPCAGIRLALEVAGNRVDVDQRAVVTGNDQAIAGEDRPEIIDLALLRLGLLKLRQ